MLLTDLPVEVRPGLASWQQVGLPVLKLHQLHEQVRLRQAEQGVNHGKVRLIKLMPHLQRSTITVLTVTVVAKEGAKGYKKVFLFCPCFA